MPARSTIKSHCDIKMNGELSMLALDAGIKVDLFYWNASIPSEVVLIVKGWPDAIMGNSPEDALIKAERLFGGL
jgi:hypothetical protein